MRLSVSQKVTEAVIFNLFTLIVWSPVVLLFGMSLSALPLDRLTNLVLSTAAVLCQERLWRRRSPLPNRTWSEQFLRPIIGTGELFILQALFYVPTMVALGVSSSDLLIGLVNLLGGSVTLWVWQEKFRWIVLVWERGRSKVVPRLNGLQRFLRHQLEQLTRRG